MPSIRSSVSDTGCRPPLPRRRPGRVTSSTSAFRWACNSASAKALRRAVKAASMACLATLMAAPRDFFSSTESCAMPFMSSVILPDLPKNCALAFSRSAGVAACANSCCALSTRESNSFISTLYRILKINKGLVPFQALALAVCAPAATKSRVTTDRDLRQPAWP